MLAIQLVFGNSYNWEILKQLNQVSLRDCCVAGLGGVL